MSRGRNLLDTNAGAPVTGKEVGKFCSVGVRRVGPRNLAVALPKKQIGGPDIESTLFREIQIRLAEAKETCSESIERLSSLLAKDKPGAAEQVLLSEFVLTASLHIVFPYFLARGRRGPGGNTDGSGSERETRRGLEVAGIGQENPPGEDSWQGNAEAGGALSDYFLLSPAKAGL